MIIRNEWWAGEISAKMFMVDDRKITPCRIHKGGSIGMHRYPTGDDINFIISGKGRAVCDGKAEQLIA